MPSIRPFGPIHWILDKLPQIQQWSVLGTIATEDRCLTAAEVIFSSRRSSDITLLKIVDPVSAQNGFKKQVALKIGQMESAARTAFGSAPGQDSRGIRIACIASACLVEIRPHSRRPGAPFASKVLFIA